MGQKSNLLTLRKKTNINFLNLQSCDLTYVNTFILFIKKFFDRKKIYLTNISFNFLSNQIVVGLSLFFRVAMLSKLKRKYKRKGIKINLIKKKININFFKQIMARLKTNLIFLSIINLNKYYDKLLFKSFYEEFKEYHTALFPRRFNFFIDFLKITTLFRKLKIDLNFYLSVIGDIFKILPKRRHNYFLSFIQKFLKKLIDEDSRFNDKNALRGLKFMLSGRITAKPRAKFKYFQLGKIPLQSIDSNVDFSKIHVFTIYGVFGLKLWTFRN